MCSNVVVGGVNSCGGLKNRRARTGGVKKILGEKKFLNENCE